MRLDSSFPLARVLAAGVFALLVLRAASAAEAQSSQVQDHSADADPFIGTKGDGEMHPAAGVPFGFVWLGPDMRDHRTTSGYVAGGVVEGFSHTHVMGTGGGSKYGNFLVTPVAGEVDLRNLGSPYTDERALPGLYRARLSRDERDSIDVELTATRFVGIHRYTFHGKRAAHLVIDVGSTILPTRRTLPVQTFVRVVGPTRIEGTVTMTGGWNPMPYTLHFAAELDRPIARHLIFRRGQKEGDFRGDVEAMPGVALASGWRNGIVLDFDAPQAGPFTVQMKLGVSFKDGQRARELVAAEAPGWDFAQHRARAAAAWRDALGRIDIETDDPRERRIFYSALYRAYLMPRDLTGEHPMSAKGEPFWTDFYCLWDTFRTLHPLLTLIQPERQRDIVRGLLTVYEKTGWLPEAFIAGSHGLVQGGSHGDVVVADAIVKGLPGIDRALAFRALTKDAEVDSPWPLYYGRDLSEWLTRGYLTTATERSVSRTLEYAYDDYVISLVADRLGRRADAEKYRARSRAWEKLWDPTTKTVRPRKPDGTFVEPYDPLALTFGFDPPYYEGNGRQYTTFVPHDVQGLIERIGGDEAFVAWLDELFEKKIFWMGNEPGFLAPWLYVHAGRPDRTADVLRGLLSEHFRDDRGGIPGNDDAGAMSSWYIWNALGLFPNAGQPYYYLGAPRYRRSVVHVGQGRRLVIEAPALDQRNRYVQSVRIDGKPWPRAFVPHDRIARGARIELVMGPEPSSWGRGAELRPPSLSPVKKAAAPADAHARR